ncbi:MAG: carboxypeptidase-like regulatory domain-containing protein, partial [Candidatus Acidiferrum sp.]
MSGAPVCPSQKAFFIFFLFLASATSTLAATSLKGILRDQAGHVIANASVSLQSSSGGRSYTVQTSVAGEYLFADVEAQT